jgi:SynChlorMet cassette radical SAM/SPASM protein ScmE
LHAWISKDVKVARASDTGADTDTEARFSLFAADTGKTRHLNETASVMFAGFADGLAFDAVAKRIASTYDVSVEEAAEDVRTLVDQLEGEGFVERKGERPEGANETSHAWPHVGDGPEKLDISITGRCNAKCKYCFYSDEMVERVDLPTSAWLSFFEELGRLPTRTISLTGGEVFTRRDLWELVDGIIGNRMRYSMLSNGTLITERTLQRFGEGKRRGRLDSIQLSVDGSCAEVHDRSRGSGMFVRTMGALRLLVEAGFPVTVRVTVNQHNVDDLEGIAHLLLEDVGLPGFSTNDAVPEGKGKANSKTIALLPAQRVKAMNTLAMLAERYQGRVRADAGPLANHRIYAQLRRWKEHGEPVPRGGYLTACGCVFGRMAILHDGAMVPCNVMPDLRMGTIGSDGISSIWQSHPTLQAMRERRHIPMTSVPGCETCEWAEACNGSCPGLAYELTGDFNRANPHDCYRRFLEETREDERR